MYIITHNVCNGIQATSSFFMLKEELIALAKTAFEMDDDRHCHILQSASSEDRVRYAPFLHFSIINKEKKQSSNK